LVQGRLSLPPLNPQPDPSRVTTLPMCNYCLYPGEPFKSILIICGDCRLGLAVTAADGPARPPARRDPSGRRLLEWLVISPFRPQVPAPWGLGTAVVLSWRAFQGQRPSCTIGSPPSCLFWDLVGLVHSVLRWCSRSYPATRQARPPAAGLQVTNAGKDLVLNPRKAGTLAVPSQSPVARRQTYAGASPGRT
jgi:hypothetical protein